MQEQSFVGVVLAGPKEHAVRLPAARERWLLLRHLAVALAASWLGLPGAASAQAIAAAPALQRAPITSEADAKAILQVTADFRAALSRKDVAALSSLLVDDKILFTSPPSPAAVRQRRERGAPGLTGAEPGGFAAFASFVAGSPVTLEERFFDVKVVQDGHLAWVSFDFDFLADGRVENQGIEAWQMLKTADDRWKILSVVWSSHGAPK